MITRIVKMEFRTEEIEVFKVLFEKHKHQIRGFEGCHHLSLLQDKNNPKIFMTYSYWDDENALNNYRNSVLFKEIWTNTKALFDDSPEAWSLNRLIELK